MKAIIFCTSAQKRIKWQDKETNAKEVCLGKRNLLLSDYSVCMINSWVLMMWQLVVEVALLREGSTRRRVCLRFCIFLNFVLEIGDRQCKATELYGKGLLKNGALFTVKFG